MIILTQRQKQIIYILASSKSKCPITMKQIAKILNLSTRTIVRDFKNIESWFFENDFKFSIRPRVGLMLNEDENTKLYIIDLLNINTQNNLSELERKILIFINLLITDQPIKSGYFIKTLNITETVFNNDFNSMIEYTNNFNIQLIKKRGNGCYLVGEEQNLRTCYISLIYEYYKKQNINILKNEILNDTLENNFTKTLLKFINKDFLIKIVKVIDKNINSFNLNLSDESYIEFIFVFAISIKRIIQNKNVIYKFSLKNNISDLEQFEVIEKICIELENIFNVNISLNEKIFIHNHFKALKKLNNFINVNNIKISKATKKLIELTQQSLNINLMEDKVFFNDLLCHLDSSIHRIKMGMKIRNPFLDDIKKEYSDIYDLVNNNVCYITNNFNLNYIPECEIGYIAMHFIVAYERAIYKNVKINAITSCSTGVGTSKILAENIAQKFQNINILDNIPSIKINNSLIKDKNIDLIISTVNINTNFKFIKVNPILDYESEKSLKKIIFEISKEKLNNIPKTIKNNNINQVNIYNTLELSNNILYILKNFKFAKDIEIKSFEKLILFTTTLFLNNNIAQKSLYNEFKERLNLNLPYFDEINLLLLHCNSKNVSNINIGVINLKNVVYFKNKKIKHSLIMILPENNNEVERELLSEISSNLINNQIFLNTIKFSDREEIINNLKNIMITFLIKKLNKLIGVK